MVDRLNILQKEILGKYNLIKEIDFKEDIDIEKSDMFYIDSEKDSIKFLFKEKEHINIEKYKRVFGNAAENAAGIKIIPELNEEFDNTKYLSASLQIDKEIDNKEIDIIYVLFRYPTDSNFYFRLCNPYFNEAINKVIKKELDYNSEYFLSSKDESIDFMFRNRSILIARRIGTRVVGDCSCGLPVETDLVELMINKNKNIAWINGKSIRLPMLHHIETKQMYINIMSFIQKELYTGETADIKSLIYGTDKGYIYLKPIEVEKVKLKIFMMYTGMPTLQYYLEKMGQWVEIKENQTISVDKKIYIRVNLRTGDNIYKLFITDSN